MAVFEYQCFSCGLRFEKFQKTRKEKTSCKNCQEEAEILLSQGVCVGFSQKVSGPVPQTTGVTSLDDHIDRVLGIDAQQKWDLIGERVKHKREFMQLNKVSLQDMARNPDGTYRVSTQEEKKAYQGATGLHREAMRQREKWVEAKKQQE